MTEAGVRNAAQRFRAAVNAALKRCTTSPESIQFSNQNVTLTPNWSVLGSPTAVTWLNVDTGVLGYEAPPKFVFRVTALARFVRLKASTSPSIFTSLVIRKTRLTRRLSVRKSLPVP